MLCPCSVITFPSLLLLWNHVVNGEITHYDFIVNPSDVFVEYGYVRGPGMIDLSDVTFTATGSVGVDDDEQVYRDGVGVDDDYLDDDTPTGRVMDRYRNAEHDAIYIDIALFRLPSSCTKQNSCDWTELGVGKRTSADELQLCCSKNAVKLGLCKGNHESYGRLLIDTEIFTGVHLPISVRGDENKYLKLRKSTILEIKKSSWYVVLYANCNEQGQQVAVEGNSIWKSKHGYLPGEFFGLIYIDIFLFIIYVVLFTWFAYRMHQFKETRIEIHKWIIISISLGLLRMYLTCDDDYVWNVNGFRSNSIFWVLFLIEVLDHAISRCLCVMVSMGWGVSRDSISGTARMLIIGLAIAYVVVSCLSDSLIVFTIKNMNAISVDCEVVVELFFIIWVLIALRNTLSYLGKKNEKAKLEKMQQLRNVFLGAAFFAMAIFLVEVFVMDFDDSTLNLQQAWVTYAASDVCYLFALIGISIIWRPSENSQEYAYFKELLPKSIDDDDDNLEMLDVSVQGIALLSAYGG